MANIILGLFCISKNFSSLGQGMRAVYLHAGFSKKAQDFFFLLPGDAQADPAVGAEVAGDRNQLVGNSLLLDQLFRPHGKMNGRKENHT